MSLELATMSFRLLHVELRQAPYSACVFGSAHCAMMRAPLTFWSVMFWICRDTD